MFLSFFLSREQINEMLCELYSPSVSMPEAPKQNFFAKLFATNAMIDPDQLCKIFIEILLFINDCFSSSW